MFLDLFHLPSCRTVAKNVAGPISFHVVPRRVRNVAGPISPSGAPALL